MSQYIALTFTVILIVFIFVRFLTAKSSQRLDVELYSNHLQKNVKVTIYLPEKYSFSFQKYPVLYLNDGQDMEALKLAESLEKGYKTKQIKSLIVVAIHADKDRMRDYGVSAQSDYMNRGDKANAYRMFVVEELMKYMEKKYRTNRQSSIAGFSLGGLSAFDIAWHHPELFDWVGVFSGALWWRKNAYQKPEDDLTDLLAHLMVRQADETPKLKFWFEAGTKDETTDRNQNGIIDAIDDTLALIHELEKKGLKMDQHIFYDQIEGGEHNFDTWQNCFPKFLQKVYAK